MVADVGVGDVVESVVKDGAEGAVHSAESTTQPSPLRATEVGHEDIGMLQVSDEHQVIVDDEVRDEVKVPNGDEACRRA